MLHEYFRMASCPVLLELFLYNAFLFLGKAFKSKIYNKPFVGLTVQGPVISC